MKKVLMLVLLMLYCSGFVFSGEFEDTLKKAEQRDAGAQNNLGVMYANGEGVTQDYKLAYVWYSLAAAQGHKEVTHNRNIAANRLPPQQLAEAQDIAGKI